MLAAWVRGETLHNVEPRPGKVRIIQTNSAGDNVHIIDPLTNTIVGRQAGLRGDPTGARPLVPDPWRHPR